jgi:hypothetical protein
MAGLILPAEAGVSGTGQRRLRQPAAHVSVGSGETRRVQEVGRAVRVLAGDDLRQQFADAGGVLEPVPAISAGHDDARLTGEAVTMHGMTFAGLGSRPGKARATDDVSSSMSVSRWM